MLWYIHINKLNLHLFYNQQFVKKDVNMSNKTVSLLNHSCYEGEEHCRKKYKPANTGYVFLFSLSPPSSMNYQGKHCIVKITIKKLLPHLIEFFWCKNVHVFIIPLKLLIKF